MGAPRDSYLTFGGPGTQEVQYVGRHIRIRETPTGSVFVSWDGTSGEFERSAGEQINLAPGDRPFERVRIRSAVAQTVVVTFADTPQDDQRTSLAVNVSATVAGATAITQLPVVTVPAGNKAKLADANGNRVELRVAVASDQAGPVWLGNSAIVAAEGGILEPGMIDYPASTAELWAYNPGAVDVDVSVLDLESP